MLRRSASELENVHTRLTAQYSREVATEGGEADTDEGQ